MHPSLIITYRDMKQTSVPKINEIIQQYLGMTVSLLPKFAPLPLLRICAFTILNKCYSKPLRYVTKILQITWWTPHALLLKSLYDLMRVANGYNRDALLRISRDFDYGNANWESNTVASDSTHLDAKMFLDTINC